MTTTLGDTVVRVGADDIQVKNIPVFICPACGKRFIHEIVIERARVYMAQYGIQDNQLDFGLCEDRESADTVTTMMTMGIL
jgi:YgiT-type zinc finger domain-containing protein